MTIRALHENLVALVAQSLPNSHPAISTNEVLAKNCFEPFNMLAISKTKLEKIGHSEELGDISLFHYGNDAITTLYLHSSKLKAYGGSGMLSGKENVVSMIETGLPPSLVDTLKKGMQQQDQVDLYISKEITKIIKGVSSKHGKKDLVDFTFTEDGIKVYLQKDNSAINMFYPMSIDTQLIGHSLDQEKIKHLKSGIWKLMDDKVYDHTGESVFLASSRRAELNGVDLPSEHITIKGSTISKMLKFVGKTVDKNNPKREINYLMIDVSENKGKLIGTDTRRLSISKEFDVNGKEGKYYIQATHLQDNPKSIKLSEKVVEIEYEDHIYKEEIDHALRYPEYQRIIPQYMKNAFEVESKELKKLKGEVFISIKDDKVYWAKADKNFGELEQGDLKQIKTVDVSSSDMFFAMDSNYIKDAVSDSEIVTVNMNERNLPIRIDGEHGMTVIMPIVAKTKAEIEEEELRRQNKQYEAEEREKARKELADKQEHEEQERLKKEDGIAHEWLNTLSPMARGKARKTMSKMMRIDGKILTKTERISKYVEEGREFKQKTYTPYGSLRERTEWGAFSDEGTWSEVTATEAKFGQYLQLNK